MTYQATVAVLADEIGLCPWRALTDLCNLIGTVGCWGTSANAEDQATGFDKGRVEIWGFQGHQLEGTIGVWQGRGQFAIITAVTRAMSA